MRTDRLHLLAGICALAFGAYCVAVGICALMFELEEFSILLMLLCFIFGSLYIIFGIFALRASMGGMGTFMFFGFFAGSYWWSSGLEWYLWPMIFMPFVILALTILIVVRFFLKARDESWRNG